MRLGASRIACLKLDQESLCYVMDLDLIYCVVANACSSHFIVFVLVVSFFLLHQPTCPFVPTSLKFDCLYLGVVSHAQASSVDSLEEVVLTMLQRFKTLEPREHAVETGGKPNPKVPYKAVILICPDVALADAPVWIDRLQRKLQPLFVAENALMLGEFHKNNNSSGLHNESFFPLRTPFPCLAMRNMVPSDIVFLNCPDYPLQTRIAMIQRYLDTFCVAGKKDGKDVLKAQEMIQKLQRENENVGV